MLQSVNTQIEAFGTKVTKAKAVDAGLDPSLTFTVVEPDLDLFDFEEDNVLDLIDEYCMFWKLQDKTVKGFFNRVRKHIMDSKRAEYHRGGSKKQQRDSLVAEMTNGASMERMLEIGVELSKLG